MINYLILTMDKQQFIKNSIDSNQFIIEDVEHDNACFYNCIATILIRKGKYNDNIIIDKDKISKKAKQIQSKIVKWIYKNRKHKIDDLGITLEEFVIYTHNLMEDYGIEDIEDEEIKKELMDEYYRRYSIFAGDDIEDEFDRWGGACEQYAVSQIYKIPINVYHYKKYDDKKDKIVNGRIRNNKAERGIRFILSQSFGTQYKDDCNYEFNVLYQNTKKIKGHYYCIYDKN